MTLLACSFVWLVGLLPLCEPDPPTLDRQAEQDLLADAARDNRPDLPYDHAPPPPPPEPWRSLAECESGDWLDGGAAFVEGSARWDWGIDLDALPPWASTIDRGDGDEAQFHGGLNFHPDTWDWIAGELGLLERYPHAYDAPAEIQVQGGREVRARQGWEAWPVCSRLVGLR